MARTKKSRQRSSSGMQPGCKAARSFGSSFPRAAPEHSCRRCAALVVEHLDAEGVNVPCSEHEAEEREREEREAERREAEAY